MTDSPVYAPISIERSVKPLSPSALLGWLILLGTSTQLHAECTYTVSSQWDGGFVASLKIKNTGTAPVSDWSVGWQYQGEDRFTNGWSAAYAGTNPYTASSLNWNRTILPNQTLEIGFQGRKGKGRAEIPQLSGSVCGDGASPPAQQPPKDNVGTPPDRASQGQAICEYVVGNAWQNGYTANIRITNVGTEPIDGWSVNWRYAGDNKFTNGWNADYSGSNPYTASNLGWNRSIAPNQTVEIGLQGVKGSGDPEIPVVGGDICKPYSAGDDANDPPANDPPAENPPSDDDLIGDVRRGASLWESRSCVACHGVDGMRDGMGNPVQYPVDPNLAAYRHSRDDQALSLRDYISVWMPGRDPQSCVGQCAADLEAYIQSWSTVSDGMPDNPVAYFSCPDDAQVLGQRSLRLLTKDEYQRSIEQLVGYAQDLRAELPDDFQAGVFASNSSLVVDRARYAGYIANAERISEDVAGRWHSVLGCNPSVACADRLVNDLAPQVFRRPLGADEKAAYQAVARGEDAQRSPAEGMKIALAAMLASPQFLYRSELGEDAGQGVYKLTGYEMATYLSYTLTGTTPDSALLLAASRGELDDVEGVRRHASILLDSRAAEELMYDFVNRWLGTDQLEVKEKSDVTDFDALAAAMKMELGKNFAAAMLDENSEFGDLYRPDYTFVNRRLAEHYELPYNAQAADEDGFVKAVTTERGGILTSGAFMSRYATATEANLITRAVAVRRRLTCQDVPEPPVGVSLDREVLFARDREFFEDPRTTDRMIHDHMTAGTGCSSCHTEIINPLGGAMEDFDAVGRMRVADSRGNPIDSSGVFYAPYPQLQFMNDADRVMHSPDIVMDGGRDLAYVMAEEPLVAELAESCLATQFVSFSAGVHSAFLIDTDRDVGYQRISQEQENAYRCDISVLSEVLHDGGPRAMLEEIPALRSVMYRQEWTR